MMVLLFAAGAFAGTTVMVSISSTGEQGNDGSDGPAISLDGRYVAFNSVAGNLVSGDTNGAWDVYLYDTLTGLNL